MKRNSNFLAAFAAMLLLTPAATAQSQSMNAYQSVSADDSRMCTAQHYIVDGGWI